MKRVSVFILDPCELIRCGVRAVVDGAPGMHVVGEAATTASAIARIMALRPDVLLLDTGLREGNMIELCRSICSRDPQIRVLALNSRADDDDTLFDAIGAGVAGYLLKEASGRELVDAIGRVAEGQSLVDPAVTARVLDRIRNGRPAPPEEFRRLSGRETDVLRLVAEGMTNREIAERMHLAEKTVKTYVSSMMAKLGVHSRLRAALLANQLLAEPRTAGSAA